MSNCLEMRYIFAIFESDHIFQFQENSFSKDFGTGTFKNTITTCTYNKLLQKIEEQTFDTIFFKSGKNTRLLIFGCLQVKLQQVAIHGS